MQLSGILHVKTVGAHLRFAFPLCFQQAFIKTAERIYEKIKDGVYDASREGNGVKLGVMAAPKGGAKKAAASGGCC